MSAAAVVGVATAVAEVVAGDVATVVAEVVAGGVATAVTEVVAGGVGTAVADVRVLAAVPPDCSSARTAAWTPAPNGANDATSG